MAGGPPNYWEEDPFEEDGDIEGFQETGTFQDFLDANGIENYYQLVIDLEDVDPSTLRGQVFYSVEEALQWLFDTGLISFSKVVRNPGKEGQPDTYSPSVGDSGAYAPAV